VKHQVKLVTANDPGLFEERLDRVLAHVPDDAVIVEIGFDTSADPSGTLHFSALIRLQVAESWS
jgi:hypothetical protein